MSGEAVAGRLVAMAIDDERVIGLVEYGSRCQGRADAWSDLDLVVVVREDAVDELRLGWRGWVRGLKPSLLLAYRGLVGSPWLIVDAEPAPLRVDLAFFSLEAVIERLEQAAIRPISAEAMVRYDGMGGRLTAFAASLVDRPVEPLDIADAFERFGGDFWYFLLRAHAAMQRGQLWFVRHNHQIIVDKLIALLRLECGEHGRLQAGMPTVDAERALPAGRLEQLQECLTVHTADELGRSLVRAAEIGRDASARIAERHAVPWPVELAERVGQTLRGAPFR